MKTTISMLFLICGALSACGTYAEPDGPLVVDGLIVWPGDVDYDKTTLHKLVGVVQDAVNKRYPGLDLVPLLEQYDLNVRLTPYDQIKVGGVYLRGNQTILLAIPDQAWEQSRQCLQMYYTLGHEMLHFVDYAYLGNDLTEHSTPNFFFQGTAKDQYSQTAEYDIWMAFADVCGYDPTL